MFSKVESKVSDTNCSEEKPPCDCHPRSFSWLTLSDLGLLRTKGLNTISFPFSDDILLKKRN